LTALFSARAARRTAHRRRRTAVGLGFAAALSSLAGMTDAVGFLIAGDFVSFMSGNTTRLAVAVGGVDLGAVLHLGLLVLVFVLGNAGGVVFAHLTGRRHGVIVGLVAALLLASAALSGGERDLASIILLVFAMGAVNVAMERVEGHALGVTYVSGALSRFGRGWGRKLLGRATPNWWFEIVPWCGMLSGAVVGAVAFGLIGASAIWLSAAWACVIAVASLAIPARWRRKYFAG
jgi:uncharacterized membrane protein YoaK (UPF0700 family)